MNSNDPVLQPLRFRLRTLQEKYEKQPDELNRYRLACQEKLNFQWENHRPMYY